MAIAGTLEIQLFANLARIRQDMDQARQIVGNAMKGVESAVNSAKQVLASLGLGLGLVAVVELIDQYTKYTTQLRLATNSMRELAAAQEEVRRISTLSQTDLSATGVLYARIMNATKELGTSQKQVGQITEVVAIALRVSGATAQESASAMLQLSQAFASGKFRGEEFNAVNEAAPRLMKALADGMGVPIGALRDMASNGLITAQVMAQALPKALLELRKEAKEVQTIGGAFTVLKNAVMEFVGVQASANGTVSVMTQALMGLAANLNTVFAILTGITAMKFSEWLATAAQGFYTKASAAIASMQAMQAERQSNMAAMQAEITRTASTLEFIAAERSRTISELAAAQATIAATAAVGAQSFALRLNAEAKIANSVATTNLANLGKMQAATMAAQTAAQTALTAAQSAGGVAATLGARALGLLGGPIGLVTTLLGLGVTAWLLWGKSSEDANKKAATSTEISTNEILTSLDKQIVKLGERLELAKKFGEIAKKDNPETERAAAIQRDINNLLEKQASLPRGTRLDRNDQFKLDQAKMDLEEMVFKIKKVDDVKKALAEIGQQPLLAKWLEKYADNVDKLAFVLARAKKEFGGTIPPQLEKAIITHFAAADDKKSMAEAEAAANTYQTELAGLSKQMATLNGMGEVEAYQLRLQEKAFDHVDEASKAYLVTQFSAIVAKKNDIEMTKEWARSMLSAEDAQQKMRDVLVDYLQSLRDQKSQLQFDNDMIGEATEKVKQLTEARRLDAQQAAAIRALGPNATSAQIQEIIEATDAAKKAHATLLAEGQILQGQQNRWKDLTSAAGSYFGVVGSGFAKMITTMVELGKKEEDLAMAKKIIANDPDLDPVKRAALIDQNERQSAQVRLGAYGDMASAAAGFFNTQSRGYKALMAASQVFHAAELALTVAEMVPKAINAVLTQGEGDPYTAFARMAAMGAIVAGLGVAIGGGGGSVVSAQSRQASQGTGSVLGDTKAKTESISKAMDMLSKNSIIGNEHTAAMVRSLRSIENSLGGLASLVVRAGLTGPNPSGFDLATTNNRNANSFGGPNPLGLPSLFNDQKFFNMIFGTTKKTISDSGLMINPQTVGQARQGVSGSAYADITSQASYLFGLIKGKPSTSTSTQDLSDEIANQFTLIVRNIYDAIVTAAKVFGSDGNAIKAILDAFKIDSTKISFKDLTGDEIQKQLEAVFSKLGDDMAGAAFAGLADFQHVGEGAFETLMRLAQEFAATDEIAKILGKDLATAFGAVGFESMKARDSLVALFGGIQELSDGVGKYYELFYTEAERGDRAMELLKEQFAAFNMTVPLTMAEYRALVEAQDLSTEAGRNMFTFLVQVAPAFNTIAQAAKTMANSIYQAALTIGGGLSGAAKQQAMQNAAHAWDEFYNNNPNRTGPTTTDSETIANAIQASTLAAQGHREMLDAMIAGAYAIGGQHGLDLLQALFDAIAANTDATGSNTGAVDNSASAYAQAMAALANARSGLADYLNHSLLSQLSPLTPMQQYIEARRQYQENLANAQHGDVNAIAGFGAIRDAFLAASQAVFGSSGQYNEDFFGSFNAGAGMTNGAVRPYTAADAIVNTQRMVDVVAEGNGVSRDIANAVIAVGEATIENAQNNSAETVARLQAAVDALNKLANAESPFVSNGF